MSRYYTYVIRHPTTAAAIYVGKGTGNRMYFHWRNRNAARFHNKHLQHTLQQLERQGLTPLYEKVNTDVTETEALSKEIELIRVYGRRDLGTGTLLNHTDGGEQGATSWSPETRRRKSEVERAKQRGRPVTQYTLSGLMISMFPSAKVAAESIQCTNRSYITQCCKGKRVSSGGFLWAYQGDPTPTYTKKYYRQVEQRSLTGELIATHQSLTHAQQASGVELHNISEACRGKSKTAGGFTWCYYQ